MTKAWGFRLCGIGMVALLAAGGGGGGTDTTPPDPVTQSDAYYRYIEPKFVAMDTLLNGNSSTGQTAMNNTAFKTMPTTGTANFTGYAGLTVDDPTTNQPSIHVDGTAVVTANFATASVSGSMTNFVGTTVDNTTHDLAGPAASYAGTLTLTNGCIGLSTCPNVTRPNQFSANVDGTLTGEGNTIVTSREVVGDFKGNPIKGISVNGLTNLTTLNGVTTNSNFLLVGTR